MQQMIQLQQVAPAHIESPSRMMRLMAERESGPRRKFGRMRSHEPCPSAGLNEPGAGTWLEAQHDQMGHAYPDIPFKNNRQRHHRGCKLVVATKGPDDLARRSGHINRQLSQTSTIPDDDVLGIRRKGTKPGSP